MKIMVKTSKNISNLSILLIQLNLFKHISHYHKYLNILSLSVEGNNHLHPGLDGHGVVLAHQVLELLLSPQPGCLPGSGGRGTATGA